jgi:hypothetical protein
MPGHMTDFSNTYIHRFVDGTTRIRPGAIIEYDKFSQDIINSSLDQLSTGINRVYFRYRGLGQAISKPYQGWIHTPTENLLSWQPYALLVSLTVLVGLIAHALGVL